MPVLPLLDPKYLKAADGEAGETPLGYIQRWVRSRLAVARPTLDHRVLIVQARTGSGKSTQLPVGVTRVFRGERPPQPGGRQRGASVLCTQPRVLTAINLCRDVSAQTYSGGVWRRRNPDMVAGATVGYLTGPAKASPAAGLIYATAGVLAVMLQRLDDDALMRRYRAILLDEAHERSIDSDLLLSLVLAFYQRNAGNPQLPFLFLMSATFSDPLAYAAYFGVGAANVFEVEGRSFQTTDHWPARGTNSVYEEAARTALEIHAAGRDDPPAQADILIFVPGNAEATAVAEVLRAADAKMAASADDAGGMLVLVLNREVVAAQLAAYRLVFEPPERLPPVSGRRPARRVIIATAVAETGLTIDTLRYVIDCGWHRGRETYYPWGVGGLVTRPAPRSRMTQRRGRAARLFDGDYYPLFTENVHASLPAQQLPEIYTAGLDQCFLVMVGEQQRLKESRGLRAEFRVEDLSLLDPPPPEAFLDSAATAFALGFVSHRAPLGAAGGEGYGLTALGRIAARFSRTPMEGARLLMAGYMWGAAASDLATAAALLQTRPGCFLAKGVSSNAAALLEALPLLAKIEAASSAAAHLQVRYAIADDFAEDVLIFDAFIRQISRAEGPAGAAAWCDALGLSLERLLETAQARELLIEDMIAVGMCPFRASESRLSLAADFGQFAERLAALKRCLYEGLRGRLLRLAPDGGYVTRQGVELPAPELYSDAQADRAVELGLATRPPCPRWLVTDYVWLSAERPKKGARPRVMYTKSAGRVVALDGFVDFDPALGEARSFGAVADEGGSEPPSAARATPDAPDALRAYGRICRAALGALSIPARAFPALAVVQVA